MPPAEPTSATGKPRPPRLLFVGDLTIGRTGEMRRRALADLGYQITDVDTSLAKPGRVASRVGRVTHRLGYPLDFGGWNRRLVEIAYDTDLLWLDKPLAVRPAAIRSAKLRNPNLGVVYYSPDNMLRPINRSRFFLGSLPEIDLFLTTKSAIVDDLTRMGCPRVHFVNNAFDPKYHAHQSNATAPTMDVSFVGTFEDDRAQLIAGLARSGISVHVFGNGWTRFARSHSRLPVVFHCPVFGYELAATLHGSRINLAFLRKANNDLQTTRTFEIPAAGGFMLAERTEEQAALFTEGIEAQYFNGLEELTAKIEYYLAHESQRATIAEAGRRRCLNGGYSYAETISAAFAATGLRSSAGGRCAQ